ncbi:RHS repeat-associated core domain-containing protein [Aeromonas dhakensis]
MGQLSRRCHPQQLRRFLGDAANDETYCELRYQGQIYDQETGLYYNRHRYFDPELGQYISSDPIDFAGGLRPQGCVHNPLEWVDPLGLAGCILKKSSRSDCDYELDVDSSVYPQTTQHIQEAMDNGHPYIVTIDRSGAKSNRAKSLKGIKTKPNLDRDEWPMAMFEEGGVGASVKHIDPSDNRGAGFSIGKALADLPDGTKVLFRIK